MQYLIPYTASMYGTRYVHGCVGLNKLHYHIFNKSWCKLFLTDMIGQLYSKWSMQYLIPYTASMYGTRYVHGFVEWLTKIRNPLLSRSCADLHIPNRCACAPVHTDTPVWLRAIFCRNSTAKQAALLRWDQCLIHGNRIIVMSVIVK